MSPAQGQEARGAALPVPASSTPPSPRELADRCAAAAARLRRLGGEVLIDPTRRSRYATDASRVGFRLPGIVVRASSEEALSAALSTARQIEIPVSIRGAGHSVNGQTLSAGGMVIANVPRGDEAPVDLGGGRFEISGRAQWWTVQTHLNRLGWSIPVLADYLGLSVGGTLAVGGYGVCSVSSGVQVDHVRRLKLVLPDGSSIWCSPDRDLFRYSLAGLGQVGVIERAVIDAVPHRNASWLATYYHSSLPRLADSLAWMTMEQSRWPDTFMGTRAQYMDTARHWGIRTAFGSLAPSLAGAIRARSALPRAAGQPSHQRPYPNYVRLRSRIVASWMALYWRRERVWSDFLVDYDGLRGMLALIDDLYRGRAFGGCPTSTYILAVRRPAGAMQLPFEASNQTDGSIRFGVGLYSFVPRGDTGRRAVVQRAMTACLEACLDLGGRPYLYGWHALDAGVMRRVYGGALDRLRELRRELDPGGFFQPNKLPGV